MVINDYKYPGDGLEYREWSWLWNCKESIPGGSSSLPWTHRASRGKGDKGTDQLFW